ncbi:grasp-with-spasm system SPASM domain peptide maturase [uncultured Algibacter sp.]|uniref:grasp-with-spasm system SPASM domain peptide maturase n=1 Tax=uncultured Algibacter sp. TaxID=298659 RepID=UPI00321649DB
MNIDKYYYKIYEGCKPVEGAKRAVICDLERKSAILITKDLFSILRDNKLNSIGEIKSLYGKDNENTIQEYFDFLIENEIIHLCEKDELDLFPEVSLKWEIPSIISNAIIDYDKESTFSFEDIFMQLNSLGCIDLLLRFYDDISLGNLKEILEKLNKTTIENIQLVLKYSNSFVNEEDILILKKEFSRLASVIIFNSPVNPNLKNSNKEFDLIYTQEVLNPESHCGFISPKSFRFNFDFYTESLKHNNCLNKKISIDINGNIKNCPSAKPNYGNISSTKLSDVLPNENFKKLWHVNKDSVEKCKDCEFRYICSDCRIFTEKDELHSKPLNCNYDPYNAKWN